jgi:hypothetical protein
VNPLTIALEIILGAIGVTVALGAPLVGIYLHHHEVDQWSGPPLVGTASDVAAARGLGERHMTAA